MLVVCVVKLAWTPCTYLISVAFDGRKNLGNRGEI